VVLVRSLSPAAFIAAPHTQLPPFGQRQRLNHGGRDEGFSARGQSSFGGFHGAVSWWRRSQVKSISILQSDYDMEKEIHAHYESYTRDIC